MTDLPQLIQPMLASLRHELGQLGSLGRDTSPFGTKVPAQAVRDARWVEPRLVGEVSFAEWTADGILRQPSWRGLRIDKEPAEVHRED
jgi:bifunctional non-homologous end joining protein LigD